MFDAALTAELETLRSHYPRPKAALVPVLRRIQAQAGWISPQVRDWVAGFLKITPMEVHEVTSFYPMLFDKPVGRHVIHVCRTLSCDACGAKELWQHLEQKLGVTRGGTTTDGRFTLLAAECLASCGTAPCMQVNETHHESLTKQKVDQILEKLS